MFGTLYLIPNTLGTSEAEPGNSLGWVIPSEVQKLTARLNFFIAESAKTTRAHLKAIACNIPLSLPLQEIQIAELNTNTEATRLPELLVPLQAGHDVGLISEAGVPAVADPGAELVRLAHQQGICVKPLVGPSSLLLAVMGSGLNGQNFAFNGYLPIETNQRARRLKQLELRSLQEKQTQLFIETPYRNKALLEAIVAVCDDNTLLCVATDLNQPTELIKTQKIRNWKNDLAVGKAPDFHRKPTVFLLLAE